eukprot:619899-Prymnesium_polylepis.2
MPTWRAHRDDARAFFEATESLRTIRLNEIPEETTNTSPEHPQAQALTGASDSIVDSLISKFRAGNPNMHSVPTHLVKVPTFVDSTRQAKTAAGLQWDTNLRDDRVRDSVGQGTQGSAHDGPVQYIYMTLTCKIGPKDSPRLLVVPAER